MSASVENFLQQLPESSVERVGCIVKAYGTTLRASGLDARVGSRVAICSVDGEHGANITNDADVILYADVVGIDGNELLLYPLGSIDGIRLGAAVRSVDSAHHMSFSTQMPGRVYDGLGIVLDGDTAPDVQCRLPLNADAPSPINRLPIKDVFATGIKAIDSLLTVGCGQRIGIFAAAGAGKSTLLNMLATNSSADVTVIALIGERGREVAEFINEKLTPETRARTVMVVSTSDRPAMERVQAARFATAVAEGFRAEGKNVLLLMDSVTRYARAMRDIGLSVGEAPVRRGFPGSVFADLPKLLERAGNSNTGSITAFYTVLTEDEENIDAIGEETRSILDGHIILSRKLGESGHYPAIDVLASTSRLFLSLADEAHQQSAIKLRKMMSKYEDIEFLVQVGEHVRGTDSLADQAIDSQDDIKLFLQQRHDTPSAFADTKRLLKKLVS